MSEKLLFHTCQKRLMAVWFVGTALVFLLLMLQTVNQLYGDVVERAWGWFLPTVVPTLSLIIGAIAYQARRPPRRARIDRSAFIASLTLSIFYLALVLATLLLRPISGTTPLEFLSLSNLWLGPTQGLVGLSLGAFFTSADRAA
jgi:hypothetical protein